MSNEIAPFLGSRIQHDELISEVGQQIRVLKKGARVRVYRNLNRPEFFSVMACTGELKGKVCGYAKAVRLVNGRFVVSEKSRQRVIKEQCRNVHAFVEGELADATDLLLSEADLEGVKVSYNPYKMGSFYFVNTGLPIPEDHFSVVTVQGAWVYLERRLSE